MTLEINVRKCRRSPRCFKLLKRDLTKYVVDTRHTHTHSIYTAHSTTEQSNSRPKRSRRHRWSTRSSSHTSHGTQSALPLDMSSHITHIQFCTARFKTHTCTHSTRGALDASSHTEHRCGCFSHQCGRRQRSRGGPSPTLTSSLSSPLTVTASKSGSRAAAAPSAAPSRP